MAGGKDALLIGAAHASAGSMVYDNPLGILVTDAMTNTGTTINLFDVTGAVLITQLYGVVTTVFAATTSAKLDAAGVDICANDVDVTTIAVNTKFYISGDFSDAGVDATAEALENLNEATGAFAFLVPFVVRANSGTVLIRWICVTSSANTGGITWYLRYIPLEDGSSVA